MRTKSFSKTLKTTSIKASSILKNNPFSKASIKARFYKKTTIRFRLKQKELRRNIKRTNTKVLTNKVFAFSLNLKEQNPNPEKS
jgi:hypothetical protein